MNNLTLEQKRLHHELLRIVVTRGGHCTYKPENGVDLLAAEPSDDGCYWPTEQVFHPPFRYSLDALHVVENLLTVAELKRYGDLMRQKVCDASVGIMHTHALAQTAPAPLRFDCLCQALGLLTAPPEEAAR